MDPAGKQAMLNFVGAAQEHPGMPSGPAANQLPQGMPGAEAMAPSGMDSFIQQAASMASTPEEKAFVMKLQSAFEMPQQPEMPGKAGMLDFMMQGAQ